MFNISSNDRISSVTFFYNEKEFSGVVKIADKVRKDISLVTGALPSAVKTTGECSEYVVAFGTAGRSAEFDALAEKSGVNLKEISGKREVYAFCISENCCIDNDSIKSVLVICGSDKRGTIYGLFHLSELLGVSPLVDWCNLLPSHKECVTLTEKDNYVSEEPSVRFRGFFINDEWPAFGNWSKHNFGGVNAEMYAHVFELLLRMKGNYLWPAMWASRFSDDGPDLLNAELADELGVVMGASHHEPCCRAGEEYKYLRGPDSVYGDAWNFRSNEKGITKFWEDGLKRNGKFENVITVGMRGEADTAILGRNATLKDNIDLLRDVLKKQNNLIKKYVDEDLMKVPRMLALYKEVEPYFYGDENTQGLMGSEELEGVTLMLCDDNHGNLRTVPTEEMRAHKGGYGMYYHFDYHGSPFSYEWFNTTNIAKVKEQMSAAYDFGIRDLWIVNVGDILTNEFPLNYFLNLAYDYKKYSSLDYPVSEYTSDWVDFNFPKFSDEQKKIISNIICEYTKIAHTRRTECLQPDTYHPVNFGEAENTLVRAEKIISMAEKIKKEIPSEYESAFFIQVYLPAVGNMNVLKMQILCGRNHWLCSKGILAGNKYVEKIRECLAKDEELIKAADEVDSGKYFAAGWSEHFGFKRWNEEENLYPVYYTTDGARKMRLYVWLKNQNEVTCGLDWSRKLLTSNAFKNPLCDSTEILLASGSVKEVPFEISVSKEWLKVDCTNGTVSSDEIKNITVRIDREKLSADEDKCAFVKVFNSDRSAGGVFTDIKFNAEVPCIDYPENTFVQTDDFISIEAEHFVKSVSGGEGEFKILPDYGKTLSAVKAFPVTKTYAKDSAPYVQYDFVLQNNGMRKINFYLNPSNPAYKDNKLQFMIELNGKEAVIDAVDSKHFAVGDNQEPWGTDVTNNIRIVSADFDCCSGVNELKVYAVTPNLVLEKIVIFEEGKHLPESYLGAPETFFVKKS